MYKRHLASHNRRNQQRREDERVHRELRGGAGAREGPVLRRHPQRENRDAGERRHARRREGRARGHPAAESRLARRGQSAGRAHGRVRELEGLVGSESARHRAERLRRREILHFALRRRNCLPLFYGVSEIFLRRSKKFPYEISPVTVYLANFSPPDERPRLLRVSELPGERGGVRRRKYLDIGCIYLDRRNLIGGF